MKLFFILTLSVSVLSCGEDEKKKNKSGGASVSFSLSDFKYWTKATTKLNGSLQGESKRTMGANGRPSELEVFNANNESISKTTFEYNESNQITKSTYVAGENAATVTTNTYDESGRLVQQRTVQGEKLLESRDINYDEIKTTVKVHDLASEDEAVLQTSEETYFIASTNIDGSNNFLLLQNGKSSAPDNSVNIEVTSDCSADTKQGPCTLTTTNLLTQKVTSEVTSTHNIRAWVVDGKEVLRDSISLEAGNQYNAEGVKTTEYESTYTHNTKYLVSEAIEKFSFPTDLQTDYTEYRVYKYDDSDLNVLELKTKRVTSPDEGNSSVTERIVTYEY